MSVATLSAPVLIRRVVGPMAYAVRVDVGNHAALRTIAQRLGKVRHEPVPDQSTVPRMGLSTVSS